MLIAPNRFGGHAAHFSCTGTPHSPAALSHLALSASASHGDGPESCTPWSLRVTPCLKQGRKHPRSWRTSREAAVVGVLSAEEQAPAAWQPPASNRGLAQASLVCDIAPHPQQDAYCREP